MLENVIYLELLRRNRKVYVGKVDVYIKSGEDAPSSESVPSHEGGKEIDFVVEGISGTEYYQVCETVLDKKTLKRELASLEAVKDHNPKFLLTLDAVPDVSHNGIKQINALDWLLA
jgi:hypothetical protein